MNTDIRNLSKWLNEEQEAPIDRQALARVLVMVEQPAQQEQNRQIDQLIQERDHRDEIIDKLCDAVLGPDRYEWSSQYFFEDAVREVEERMAEQPAQRKPLTDEEIKDALADMSALQMPFNKLIPAIARAIEAKLKEKNT